MENLKKKHIPGAAREFYEEYSDRFTNDTSALPPSRASFFTAPLEPELCERVGASMQRHPGDVRVG